MCGNIKGEEKYARGSEDMKFDKEKHKGLAMICVYAFVTVILAAVVIVGGVLKVDFSKLAGIMTPFLYAFAISYILNKLIVPFRRWLSTLVNGVARFFNKDKSKEYTPNARAIKYVSIFLAYVVFLLLIYLFFLIVAPQITSSIADVVENYKKYLGTATAWIQAKIDLFELPENMPDLGFDLVEAIKYAAESAIGLIKNVSPRFTNVVGNFALEVKNILFALFISIYMLIGKETFKAQARKLLKAFTNEESYNKIITMASESDDRFGGFLVGKIIDSIIIGALCYICCLIFGFPFPALISFIIGVTNIIPIAGPFIGAIPSAFLILLVEPQKVLWFILFVFVLQQLDGNFIGPKILGESTGLSSFWVLTSLIVMGSLYGITGMIIAVPLCSVIYYEIKILVENKLAAKDAPTDTTDYASEDERILVAKPIKTGTSKRLAQHFANLEAIRRRKAERDSEANPKREKKRFKKK